MRIDLPQHVEFIIATLEEEGHEAFVVGGSVRDAVRGVPPEDWDLCTSALPEQIASVFEAYHVIETGLKHGTVTLMLQNEPYEITTYRSDGVYSDGRHPDGVTFIDNVRGDLARRDFTVNAMAYNPRVGLADPFGGLADIEQRMIRVVGSADERFKEDALRIMRALRFASMLGFTIEHDTSLALFKNKQLLQSISVERIATELKGLLLGSCVEEVLLSYVQVLAVPLPEIQSMVGFDQNNPHHIFDVWQHTARSIACAPKDLTLRLTMLLHDIAKPHCYTEADGVGHFYGHAKDSAKMAKQILERLKFDKASIRAVTELVLYHDVQIDPQEKYIKRWLNRIGEVGLRQLIEVKRADNKAQAPHIVEERLLMLDKLSTLVDEVVQQQQCFSLKDLAVNGDDLIAAGVPEGEQIGRLLDELLNKVIDEELVNERDELLGSLEEL